MPKPKRVLLKWSLLATALLIVYGMWQCGTGLMKGGQASDTAVAEFHRHLNAGQFDAIYDASNRAFQQSGDRQELLKFFAAIHTKLGNAGTANRKVINVNTTTSGTFVTVSYETAFEKGSAIETFTWRKSITGELTLVGYNINSKALILQ